MIGNDIVDLQLASRQSNWKRNGFLNKVYNKQEQKLIMEATCPDQMVWRLWSMKESAYKAYVREFKKPFFNPRKINCAIISDKNGVVYIMENCYELESQCTHQFIYSSVQSNSITIDNFISSSPIALTQLGFSISVEIKKDKYNIPNLIQNSNQLPYFFAKTHHGRFVAYSISKST